MHIFLAFPLTSETTGPFPITEIPSGDLQGSSWNKYVYRTYTDSSVNQTICSSMCAFDYTRDNSESCNFFVLDGTKCYLGTLNHETTILDPAPTVAMQMKSSEYRTKYVFTGYNSPNIYWA
jgi:hypothetical protein